MADFGSMLDYAWCLLLVDRRRYIKTVEQAAWWADHSTVDERQRNRLTMLQSSAAILSGNWAESEALARQALEEMGETWWRDTLGRFVWNMIARGIALSERWSESCDDVRNADLALSRDPERRLALEGTRALGDALAGRPVDALRVAAGIRHAAHRFQPGGPSRRVGARRGHRASRARRPVAGPHRARGDRGDAGGDNALLPGYRHAGAHRGAHRRRRARSRRGHLRTGRVVDRVRVLRSRLPAVAGESWNTAGRRRRRHFRRDSWALQIDDPFWAGVSSARAHLAAGNAEDAASSLDTAVPRCPRHEVILGLLSRTGHRRQRRVGQARRPRPSSSRSPTRCCKRWPRPARKRSSWSNAGRGGRLTHGLIGYGGVRRPPLTGHLAVN